MNQLDKLQQKCVAALSNPHLDPDVSDELRERFNTVQRRVSRLEDKDSFRRFLRAYIQDEYLKYTTTTETEDTRDKPLCHCAGAPCELQQGQLPERIKRWGSVYRPTPDPDELVLQFSETHETEVVITEARDAWYAEFAECESEFLDIILAAKKASRPELA
ncbi:hypothetical protein ACOZ35_03215 [Halorubrum xinjiangense]|uniref:hypothetical protein n=1 Tax=Halorubrum xinjiangense TaxID=261291 RepID=UPI003C6FFC76